MNITGKRLLWLIVPVAVTISQICFRMIGLGNPDLHLTLNYLSKIILNRWFLIMLISETVGFLVWMNILSEINLSKAMPVSAICYLLILPASALIFHETISIAELIGTVLIIGGIVLIGTSPDT